MNKTNNQVGYNKMYVEILTNNKNIYPEGKTIIKVSVGINGNVWYESPNRIFDNFEQLQKAFNYVRNYTEEQFLMEGIVTRK